MKISALLINELDRKRKILSGSTKKSETAISTYFAAAPLPARVGFSFVDGGVWANNPARLRATRRDFPA
jgi:patatin-like phospholipase/acyl hydrolase